jgi:hypothetical protein
MTGTLAKIVMVAVPGKTAFGQSGLWTQHVWRPSRRDILSVGLVQNIGQVNAGRARDPDLRR